MSNEKMLEIEYDDMADTCICSHGDKHHANYYSNNYLLHCRVSHCLECNCPKFTNIRLKEAK